MSEWDNAKRVAEPAGLAVWGYRPALDRGGEVWFQARGYGLAVGRGDALLERLDEPVSGIVEHRVALFDEAATLFVEAERRSGGVVVRRGLLNGTFHEALADESLEALVQRYTSLGFKRGFGWNVRASRTILREFRGAAGSETRRTIRVDGDRVVIRDPSGGDAVHVAPTRDEAIALAEQILDRWQREGLRLVLVEDWRADAVNPMPAWEQPKEEQPREPSVPWRPPPTRLDFDARDVEAAASSAPPSLIGVEAKLGTLRALDRSRSLSELLAELHPFGVQDIVVLAELARREGAAAGAAVVEGSWHPDEASVVLGDLEVQGDLRPRAPLVVTGQVEVRGHVEQVSGCPVVVLGRLRARSVYTEGAFVLGGDCEVQGVVYGEHNDEALEIHGDLRAGALVSDEHPVEIRGTLELRHRPERSGVWGPDVFDARDEEHWEAVVELLGEDRYDYGEQRWDWDRVPVDF